MERDTDLARDLIIAKAFQSTRSVWSATAATAIYAAMTTFQSTRSVWSATMPVIGLQCPCGGFNPRAPYGARHRAVGVEGQLYEFQSTRSVWSAT